MDGRGTAAGVGDVRRHTVTTACRENSSPCGDEQRDSGPPVLRACSDILNIHVQSPNHAHEQTACWCCGAVHAPLPGKWNASACTWLQVVAFALAADLLVNNGELVPRTFTAFSASLIISRAHTATLSMPFSRPIRQWRSEDGNAGDHSTWAKGPRGVFLFVRSTSYAIAAKSALCVPATFGAWTEGFIIDWAC